MLSWGVFLTVKGCEGKEGVSVRAKHREPCPKECCCEPHWYKPSGVQCTKAAGVPLYPPSLQSHHSQHFSAQNSQTPSKINNKTYPKDKRGKKEETKLRNMSKNR